MEEKYQYVETINYGEGTHVYKVREFETDKVRKYLSSKFMLCLDKIITDLAQIKNLNIS